MTGSGSCSANFELRNFSNPVQTLACLGSRKVDMTGVQSCVRKYKAAV